MERIVTEVAVIGAGPGGYPAAFALADKGKESHAYRSRGKPRRGMSLQGMHTFKGSFARGKGG